MNSPPFNDVTVACEFGIAATLKHNRLRNVGKSSALPQQLQGNRMPELVISKEASRAPQLRRGASHTQTGAPMLTSCLPAPKGKERAGKHPALV